MHFEFREAVRDRAPHAREKGGAHAVGNLTQTQV